MAKIILLNGVSSAGKTSIAKVLQQTLSEPYLHVPIDSFEEMVPGRETEPGFSKGQIFNRMLSGMHHSITAMASVGNNLIVDHVIIEGVEPGNWLAECVAAVAPFETYFVGVRCSLAETQRREAARGDRAIGLAEWQSSRMHLHRTYDLEVDTTEMPTEQAADMVKQFVECDGNRQAIDILIEKQKLLRSARS